MHDIRVSVVVPAFNEEARIERCLESIKAQTLKPYEIILGDGSSTDKTRQIAKKYVTKITIQKKRSASTQRQGAAAAAKGSIIAFIDSDTVADRNWLKKTVEKFESDPAVVGVYGSVQFFDGSWFDKLMANIFNIYIGISGAVGFPAPAGMNMAARADAFKRIGGFNTSLNTAEDLDLFKRLKRTGRIKFSNAIVYTSARRIKRWGYPKFIFYHLSNLVHFRLRNGAHAHFENIR